MGVPELADKQVAALSSGELARVLLARAIARKPNLLIMDEPLAAVDVAGEAALYRLIADLRGELGCGALLVSHDLHVVMGQADRVVCLNRHICCEGKAEAAMRHREFAWLFGARAARVLALYTHVHDHAHAVSGEIAGARRVIVIDDFPWRTILGAGLLGAAAGPIGCFILWRRMAYLGESVAHLGLTGVAIGLLLAGWPIRRF